MSYLLDTGILLRLVDDKDPQHSTVRLAVRELIRRRDDLMITTQNVAEFCNVATRPQVNNGLGIPTSEAIELLERESASHAKISRTTRPLTSVKRKSRPA